MTTAAYKGGLMVADTRAYGFDRMRVGSKVKVSRLEDGRLVAVSTVHLGVPAVVLEWIRGGMDQDKVPALDQAVEVLVVHPDGSADVMDAGLRPSRVMAPHYAIGSGKEYAMAALHLGLSPQEAVALACDLDVWTDYPLEGLTHGGERVSVADRGDLVRGAVPSRP